MALLHAAYALLVWITGTIPVTRTQGLQYEQFTIHNDMKPSPSIIVVDGRAMSSVAHAVEYRWHRVALSRVVNIIQHNHHQRRRRFYSSSFCEASLIAVAEKYFDSTL